MFNNKNETPIKVTRDKQSGRVVMVQARDHQGRVVDLPCTGVSATFEAREPGDVALIFHAGRVEFAETQA